MADVPRHDRVLRRSRSDRLLGGVCSGIARYFDTDPLVIRLVFIVFTLAQGAGVLLYVLLWVLIAEDGIESAPSGGALVRSGVEGVRQDVAQAADRLRAGAPHRQGAWLGGLLVVAGVYLLAVNAGLLSWWSWTVAGPLILIAAGAAILIRRLR